jgi:hypothetical protein
MERTAPHNGKSMECELRSAVERITAGVLPERGPVTEMVRLHAPAHLSRSFAASGFPMEELSIGFADGSSMQVIFKDLAPPTTPSVHGKKRPSHRPSFLDDPRREIAAYRSVLSSGEVAAPRFLGAVEDDEHKRFWLFLEDVSGMPLAELKFEFWLDAARWLAGMHRQFEAKAALLSRESSALLRYDEDYFRLWILRAAEYHPKFRPLMANYGRVVERLVSLPATFVHGAFFASNVLMQNSPWGPLVRPIDWEMAGVGPGAIDLAALMADGWNGEQRGALLSAYYEVWSQGGHAATPIELFHEDVSFCRLHHAVQCAGWSEHCPRAAEGRDWEAEAMRLARKVGVV